MAPEWNIASAVNELTAAFEAAGLDTPRLDARILVGHAVQLEPSLLFARGERVLTDAEATRVRDFAARRGRREPVSRITGYRGFWGLDFALTPDTLDPRPDTETVVNAVLARRLMFISPRVLDLGTGTGCILLAILHDWPAASGVGVDLSPGAVAAASENAERLGFARRASFRQGSWCAGLDEYFDVIVSNPPYISDTEMAALAPEVGRFDPHLALAGGADGLAAYRDLIPAAWEQLNQMGRLFLEIGAGQAREVAQLLTSAGFSGIAEYKDLAGIVRCLEGVKS